MLFCDVGFAQEKEVMVVRQTDGKEVRFDVSVVERVYVETESPSPEEESVDFGLPSGIRWATCNLGAASPEDYGDYYGWGCSEPYASDDDVTWSLYFRKIGGSGSSSYDCGTDKDPLKDYVYPNATSIAGTEWDVARRKLGGSWRMPTLQEVEELMNKANCTWEWTMENGVKGYKVTSKHNGNSIFLPAPGYRYGNALYNCGSYGGYWSASPFQSNSDIVNYMLLNASYFDWNFYGRCYGFTIRPVSE